ncbi:MAG: hypothetical protein HeimC2_16090 [Candidatus Heimdallarchaeota archaeon LC_2]|nr:MAG: hypothetical protein HeimC2_16090 [Candidatus Heimdallarchaeota archaeon LC_2]
MANNDSVIGGILVVIGGISLIAEIIFLIVKPLKDDPPFDSGIYWAMAIPLFLGVAGVLAILIWIGVTMIQTPPPEAWDFDDLEDELGEELEDQGKGKSASSDLSSVVGLSKANMETLIEAGIDTKAKLASSTVEQLSSLKGIGKVSAEKIIASAK